jgi:hypothetical protein
VALPNRGWQPPPPPGAPPAAPATPRPAANSYTIGGTTPGSLTGAPAPSYAGGDYAGPPTGAGLLARMNYKPPAAPSPTGSQSGPGYLADRYNAVATGTDPGMEYAMGHGTALLNRASAARGGFNSSAAFQGLGSMYGQQAVAQGQRLDNLAAGASGEHAGQVGESLGVLGTIANGEASAAQPYGMASGGAQNQAAQDAFMTAQAQAGIDPATAAQKWKDLMSGVNLATTIAGAKPAG